MPHQVIDAVIPAGGTVDAAFAAEAGSSFKALSALPGGTPLRHVTEVLRATGRVRRIVVVGPEAVRDHIADHVDATLPEGASGPDNLVRALHWLQKEGLGATDRVLTVACDLPLLSTEGIAAFLDAVPVDAEVSLPLVDAADFEARYPGAPATFVALRSGKVTAGCAYVLRADAVERARRHVEAVFQNRKSKLGMARVLGLPFVWKFLTKSLRLEDIERRATQLLGCNARAVPNGAPDLAFDIDDLDDLRLARRLRQAG